jgi:predicted transcriptional regulator
MTGDGLTSDRMRRMAKDLLDSALWERFEEAARKRRRDPIRLLKEFMRERLEVWEDQKLDRQIKKAALRSGRREEHAVEIVRHHRVNKSRPSATA